MIFSAISIEEFKEGVVRADLLVLLLGNPEINYFREVELVFLPLLVDLPHSLVDVLGLAELGDVEVFVLQYSLPPSLGAQSPLRDLQQALNQLSG